MEEKPAVSLAAMRGKRRAAIEMAGEIERQGFAGVYCPSFGDAVGLCGAMALTTREMSFGTAIASIYLRHASDYAQSATMIHELSGGRFRFGIGVSHAPVNSRLGVSTGKPIDDMRRFVGDFRKAAEGWGETPPVILAALRRPMVRLAAEIADGAVWANAARSHLPSSLGHLGEARSRPGFLVGNMIPTCLSDDRQAAAAVNRRTLTGYLRLPNYRRYWAEAGYAEEMQAIETALAAKDFDRLPHLMTDRWLEDCTLFGTAHQIRDGVEAWRAAGLTTPILVPSSCSGGQFDALRELFAAYA